MPASTLHRVRRAIQKYAIGRWKEKKGGRKDSIDEQRKEVKKKKKLATVGWLYRFHVASAALYRANRIEMVVHRRETTYDRTVSTLVASQLGVYHRQNRDRIVYSASFELTYQHFVYTCF